MTLFIHADPADMGTDARGIGNYAQFDDPVLWRAALGARSRCPCDARNLPCAQDSLGQRFGLFLDQGQHLLRRGLPLILRPVS